MSAVVVIGWYCIVWSGWFCLNCCSQCNHAFACSLAATMHTHTAPPTSYCTIASIPFSHCFCLLSPPGTDKPCCSGTQGGLLTSSLYNVLQVLKGVGLDWRCGGGAQISPPTTIIYSVSRLFCVQLWRHQRLASMVCRWMSLHSKR